jgi:hypothetical protein
MIHTSIHQISETIESQDRRHQTTSCPDPPETQELPMTAIPGDADRKEMDGSAEKKGEDKEYRDAVIPGTAGLPLYSGWK